jgi:23S rRNA pseudouridine1911/1915/1917 synthase
MADNKPLDRITGEARVSAGHTGARLDQAAADLFPGYSRARLQKWIREGAVTVDGRPGKPSQRLAGSEHLRLDADPVPDDSVQAQDLPINVLFEDEHLIVLDKPAGLVVHPAAGHPDGTLQNALLNFDSALATIPRAGIVHRLDKDTSGVMVVARSLLAHASLVDQLQTRRMSRVYQTVVHGQPDKAGTVDAPIGRHPHDRKRMAVVVGGKPAVSHYRLLGRFGHFSHLRVALESGRTHQIRVHMQHLGYPVVGDPTYGRKLNAGRELDTSVSAAVQEFPRQALHARALSLVHPADSQERSFRSPLPDDLQGLLAILAEADPA